MYMGLDGKKFELLLQDKMHKELIKKLDSILKKINSNDNSLDLTSLETAISNISLRKEIEEIPKSILALSDVILNKINDIKTENVVNISPKEWVFDVYRDANGFIDVVKAKSE